MSPAVLLGIGAVGMALLLFLVLKAKVQPFVALLVVSTGVALAGGVPPAELVDTIEKGMGSTLASTTPGTGCSRSSSAWRSAARCAPGRS
ncbi:hypothetical protein [Saccharopolyspora shandongensis]|uniref:GntT/GntP/DsdX family permease n=1 Tax=Saccharopolyspora shandongensis TaxID=418495 RepID=UPI0033C5171B